MNLFDLRSKNCIITGGAMGIGFGIAKRYVEGGANVVIADVDGKAALAAVEKLKAGPGKAVALTLDVAADDAGTKAVHACVNAFGSVDVLVNNAGVYPQMPMMMMPVDAFDRVIKINLRGLVLMSKAVAGRLIEQGHGGRIINIGSVDSLHPSMVGLAAYDASKGAVLMFTRSFALELAPHRILVNAILPGGVVTEGTSKPLEGLKVTPEVAKAQMEGYIKLKVPAGRMGEPDEIAGAAIFLATKASSYMTGASMVIDGGMLLT